MMNLLCVDFIKHMSAGKLLLYSTNSVSPNDHKDDKIICKYFTDKYVKSLVCIKKN